MAKFNYAGMRDKTVANLLDKFGYQVIIEARNPGTFDPVTGTVTDAAPKQYKVNFVETKNETNDGENSGVRSYTITGYVDTASFGAFVPDNSCTLIVNNRVYAIDSVDPVRPGGVALMYEITANS
jgi:hypothetical protein